MKNTTRLILLIIVFILLGLLVWNNMRHTTVYYLTVREAQAQKLQLQGKNIRIIGTIKINSVLPDMESQMFQCTLADKAGQSINVLFADNNLAPLIKNGAELLIEGQLDPDGNLIATQVINKCPSKYESKK